MNEKYIKLYQVHISLKFNNFYTDIVEKAGFITKRIPILRNF